MESWYNYLKNKLKHRWHIHVYTGRYRGRFFIAEISIAKKNPWPNFTFGGESYLAGDGISQSALQIAFRAIKKLRSRYEYQIEIN